VATRSVAILLGLAASLLAGCALPPQGPAPASGPLLGAESGLASEPRTGATLESPPDWRLGEWWHVSFSAPPYSLFAEVDAVVAGTEEGRYLVGMADQFDDGVMLLHFPGFGEIDAATLGFDAHDRPIVPLQFPLREGKTWETQWYTGAPLTATVDSIDAAAGTAFVRMTGGRNLELVYDAHLGAISRLAIDGYGGFEVTDHGFGYHGKVVIPSHQDLVFCHGRQAVVQAVDFCVTKDATDPKAPTQTIHLEDAYDRVSFGLFLRDTQEAPVGPGILTIRVEAPDGSTFEATKTPTTTGMILYAHAMQDPAGDWQVTAVAAGEGLAILEGVAYRVLVLTL
jgi:hypothetical protein